MSAEANQPSGGSSPLRSPTTFQQFTQTVSSEEEASEAEEESSQEESPLLKGEEYPEEDEYLEKETRLNGKEYLCEQETLKEKEDLQKEESPEGKDYLTEEESLEREFKVASPQTPPNPHASSPAAGVSQMTAFLMAPPPISEPASEHPYHDGMPSTSFVKDDGEFLGWRDQSTQTEWIYETKAPLKEKSKAEKASSASMLPTLNSDLEEHITTELQEEEKGENPTEYIQTPLVPTGSRPGDGPRVAGCLGGPACTKSRENPGTCWAHSPGTWRRETEQETERGSLVQDSVTWDGTTRPSPYPGTGVPTLKEGPVGSRT